MISKSGFPVMLLKKQHTNNLMPTGRDFHATICVGFERGNFFFHEIDQRGASKASEGFQVDLDGFGRDVISAHEPAVAVLHRFDGADDKGGMIHAQQRAG